MDSLVRFFGPYVFTLLTLLSAAATAVVIVLALGLEPYENPKAAECREAGGVPNFGERGWYLHCLTSESILSIEKK